VSLQCFVRLPPSAVNCLVSQSAPFCCLPVCSTQFLTSDLTNFHTAYCCAQNGVQFLYGGSPSKVYCVSKMMRFIVIPTGIWKLLAIGGCIRPRLHWGQNRHNTTVCKDSRQGSRYQTHTIYVSGYTEINPTGMLSPPTVWRQQSFVWSRLSGQTPVPVRIEFECCYNGLNISNRAC
jgi:hypothetical protein